MGSPNHRRIDVLKGEPGGGGGTRWVDREGTKVTRPDPVDGSWAFLCSF